MIVAVHIFKVRPVNVRVYLRGGDVDVSKHLLNRSQVGSAFKKVRCK